jgi:hypothetical protein
MPIGSTLDVVIQQDDLVVLGPPSSIDVAVDIGPKGDNGTQLYTGAFDPNTLTFQQFQQIYGDVPRVGDLFLRTDPGSQYGSFYQYSSIPGGDQWEIVVDLVDVFSLFLNSNPDYLILPKSGGTGIDNGENTITISGNLQISGGFDINILTTGLSEVTLPTSGTIAVKEDKLSSFAATTSAELAGIISDETGSGSLVFNNSPTFTGNLSVGTINSGTWEATDIGLLHGGTNASLTAVNGGVVYSTGSAMAISSAGSTGQVLTSNGSSAPTWQNIVIPPAIISEKTSAYTVQLVDSQTIIEMNSASAIILTIPADSSVNFPIGSNIDIVQTGTGQVEVQGEGGVTLLSKNSNTKTFSQYSGITIYKKAANNWVIIGDLST